MTLNAPPTRHHKGGAARSFTWKLAVSEGSLAARPGEAAMEGTDTCDGGCAVSRGLLDVAVPSEVRGSPEFATVSAGAIR